MSPRRRTGLLALAATALALGWFAGRGPAVVDVSPGMPVEAALGSAPAGSVLRLLPGEHEPFAVRSPAAVVAEPGATVGGGIRVLADGVRLSGLTVVGGENGVTVREADGVVLTDVVVRGAELHGIEVVDASARITGCAVTGLASPYAQGIEIRNANGRSRTVVEGCTVRSGQEGLVSHVSRVEFVGNEVSGTTMRGITVTEMSEGLVEDNVVRDTVGAGLYCGDMSHCEFVGNAVAGVAADPAGVRSRSGLGAVAWFYSTMRVRGNAFEVEAPEPVLALHGSTLAETFPLAVWPAGWRGALPGLGVTAAAFASLLAARWLAAPLLRRRARRLRSTPAKEARPGAVPGLPEGAAAVLLAGLAVQTFHMLEHGVQVFQVYVAEGETRSGLAGQVADTEWVHFVYNAAVLAFMAWACRLLLSRRWGTVALAATPAAGFLAGATLIQAYHFAEHAAKVVQHSALGIDPAPGIVGGRFGLVWFHFGINLAVYAGFALAVALLLWPAAIRAARRARPTPEPDLAVARQRTR